MLERVTKSELERFAREYAAAKTRHAAARRAEERANDAWNTACREEVDAGLAEDKARDRFLRLALRAAAELVS